MSLLVETYYSITEKHGRLEQLYNSVKERVIFIVPSGLDKEPILKLISGKGSFFGKRPDIWTWGEFYRETSQLVEGKARRVIDPPDHHLIIRYILDLYIRRMKEEGVELPPGIYHKGFESILGDNIRDLLAEEILPEYMSKKILEEEHDQADPEAILVSLYTDYINYLKAYDIADNAQIPTLIYESLSNEGIIKFVNEHMFVPVGFLSFTGGQIKLLKALGELTGCNFILPETGIEGLHDAISQVKTQYKDRPKWTTNIIELQANNTHLQFDAIARELVLWIHGKSSLNILGDLENFGDIGIQILPQHLHIIENSLARYKIPFNIQIRGSVGETLLGELPKLIWDAYSSGWSTTDTVFLLSSPLLCCHNFNAQDSMSKSPYGYESWLNTLSGMSAELFKKINLLCSDLAEGGTPVELLRFWQKFLFELDCVNHLAIFVEEKIIHDHVIKDLSSSLVELDKKIEILDDMSKDIGEAAKREIRGTEAVIYILDWGRTATLPIQLPQSRSITLYAGIPPVLTSHKYWIMTDVDYNTWPGKLRESPLLCNESKKKINVSSQDEIYEFTPHIPDIHEEREQKEALFRRLIATGEKGVIFTRSLTDSNGRPVGASQFVDPLFASPDSERTCLKRGQIEYPLSKSLPGDGEIWFPGAEVLLYAEKAKRGEMPRKSVVSCGDRPVIYLSSLDQWLACPYRYWCISMLRLEKPLKDLFNPIKAGNFLHSLWEMAWKDHIKNGQTFLTLYKKYWNEACIKKYPELSDDARLIRHLDRLKKQVCTIAELQDLIESEPVVNSRIKVELEFQLPDYEVEGVIFRGRCDRIDFYENGAVVLDYKSNRASDHKNELQLAAYSVILNEKCGLDPYGYGWIGHGDGNLYGYFSENATMDAYHASKNKKNMEDFFTQAKMTMSDMAKSVKTGQFTANYQSDKCRYCECYTICRRKEALFKIMEDEETEAEAGAFND